MQLALQTEICAAGRIANLKNGDRVRWERGKFRGIALRAIEV
jgi:hypothetical protein